MLTRPTHIVDRCDAATAERHCASTSNATPVTGPVLRLAADAEAALWNVSEDQRRGQ